MNKLESFLKDVGELKLIEIIEKEFKCLDESVVIDIGDDAACIKTSHSSLLFSTDSMVEEIHFSFKYFTPYQVGYKLVVSNVSDIYAMGGTPRWGLLNFTFPVKWKMSMFYNLIQGIKDASKKYGILMIGGDLTSTKNRVTLSMTVIGEHNSEIVTTRKGAKVGDSIYLTGAVGESALGFEILKMLDIPIKIEESETFSLKINWQYIEPLLRRFLLPELCNPCMFKINKNAMIDISDGLFIDLYRLCKSSNTGAKIYEDKLPITKPMKIVSDFLELDLYNIIISGGEDYQYLIVSSSKDAKGLYRIGEIIEQGLYIVRKDSSVQEIIPYGYQHF